MDTLQSTVEFIKILRLDKLLPIVASLAALGFSYAGYRQRDKEGQLGMRKQLTDLLEKLTDLNLERSKVKSKPEEYSPNYLGLLNDQRRFLVRQTAYLAEQIGHQVSPYEYRLIADGFADIDDVFQAEKYYKDAIAIATHKIDRSIIIRAYARLHFIEGRKDEGQALFAEALTEIEGQTDRAVYFRVESYERWGLLEGEFGAIEKRQELLTLALSETAKYGDSKRSAREKARLELLLAAPNK